MPLSAISRVNSEKTPNTSQKKSKTGPPIYNISNQSYQNLILFKYPERDNQVVSFMMDLNYQSNSQMIK